MNHIEFVRGLAAANITTDVVEGVDDPWDVVALIPSHPAEEVDQEETARQAEQLDCRNCLGRLATGAMLFERHFPGAHIEYGEVLNNAFRTMLLAKVKQHRNDKSYLLEILMYEEPHCIPVMNGQQYEPLSLEWGRPVVHTIVHPRIATYPVWESVAAARQVSVANLQIDPQQRLELLYKAQDLQPGLVVVDQSLAATHGLLGNAAEAATLARTCFERRPTARTALYLYCLTGESRWWEWVEDTYGKLMLIILGKEVTQR